MNGNLRINPNQETSLTNGTTSTVQSTWTAQEAPQQFTYSIVTGDPGNATSGNFQFKSFSSNFNSYFVSSNQPITVTSNFTAGALDYWLKDITVEVPARLPLFGAGAAFAWSRKLRNRIKSQAALSSLK